ncbi:MULTISPECIES: hypothetical protein [unclassified Corallococcus]|uniref:hypothetical protein n=1 Tax=unclassified Corallococcus TaxID=2685029 RepID=UPI001A8CB84F|nr:MULTISPECIES: hypothetical protein [unclassified Corallococcus]MBN9683984.1 hypothetical protein [Corallococcus sp. NCSPR001]WAS84519.1 hypothetical protein O0N60_35260 [Corallococcus sp. NCRR]
MRADECRIGEDAKDKVLTVGGKPKLDVSVNAYADLQFAYSNLGEDWNRADGSRSTRRAW